jgi:hypothetical protein
VTTAQIYKGSIAFIVLQIAMVAAVIAFPTLVTGGIEKTVTIDADKALEQLQMQDSGSRTDPMQGFGQPAASAPEGASAPEQKDDPMKGLLESIKEDQKK